MPKYIYGLIFLVIGVIGCNKSYVVLDENMKPPKLIEKPIFVYPRYAQENNISGEVHLLILVDKTGEVDSVLLDKSSGHKILDESAISFVKKFKFIPAEKNGNPIKFYIGHTIDYSLVEINKSAQKYIKQIKKLQKNLKNALPEERIEIQKEIIAIHNNFIKSNTDYLNYNQYIKELVKKDTYNRWNQIVNDWPLHFIVFHDFQESYPNSELNITARDYMFEYMKKDIDYVESTVNINPELMPKKNDYYKKLKSFLQEEYTNMVPDTLSYLLE